MSKMFFSEEHEWVRIDDDNAAVAVVGITEYAQDTLGDIVYVELPDVGISFEKGGEVAVIESAKAASDIYAPISGEIVEVNAALEDEPSLVNTSPMNDGWLFKITIQDDAQLASLMSEDAYRDYAQSLS